MDRVSRLLRLALGVQLAYVVMLILWQGVGLALLSQGRPALGPTASLAVAAQAAVMGVLFAVTIRWAPFAFAGLSAVTGLLAATTILNAFTADPELWPSDASRYLGVFVNAVGVLGFALALAGVLVGGGGRRPDRAGGPGMPT